MKFNNSLLNSFKWSFLAESASKIIQPLILVLLARILSPEDFGIIAAATMVITFSQIFWEAGMNKAIIQRQTRLVEATNTAFLINVTVGLLLSLLLYIFSHHIAQTLFQDPRVADVLRALTSIILFKSFSSIHTALLQKEMLFRSLFWVRFITVCIPGASSIILAILGYGYWSLVIGTILGQLIQTVMLWKISKWRPSAVFDKSTAKEMTKFGAWVGLSGLLAWFYLWADSLIVSMYLGSHELGLYQTGNQFSSLIFIFAFGPITPVLYSHFSKISENQERLKLVMQKVIKVLIIIAIPTAFIVLSLSAQIGTLVFGQKWHGIGFVIGIMALMHGYSWIVGLNGEVYRAIGRPSLETIVMASMLMIYLIVYIISIKLGFEIFIYSRLSLALMALMLHIFLLKKTIAISLMPLTNFIMLITLISIISTKATSYLLSHISLSTIFSITIGCVINYILIFTTIYIKERNDLFIELFDFIKKGK